MQNKTSVLKVNNLTKKFKNFTAVDNISFDLFDGEILGFLGPNGAGKTTTIQMLLDLLTPTSGSINYFGKDLSKYRSEILEKVAFASAYLKLPGSLTVEENLNFWGKVYGLNKQTQKEYIDKNLKFFGLNKLKNNLTRTLSAGELTRVMLAKAFLPGIKIVLLDEPTAALDPDISSQIREFILTEVKQLGISIIFTSHNMQEVEEVCDRLLILKNGKIIASETPANLINQVKTCHVQLIISKNLEKLIVFLNDSKYNFNTNKDIINIDLNEQDISTLFLQMAQIDVHYVQVSIDKPNLEDYFLSMSKN